MNSQESGISAIEIFSLISSIASLILAIVAIWLSIVFFKMSDAASKATTEAAKGIGASVDRLEKLFDKLYSDTFSMMRDTVSDMRKHIWNNPSEEKTEISQTIKNEISKQVSKVLEEEGLNNSPKKQEMSEKLEGVLENSFKQAKQRKQTIKSERLLATIKDHQPVTMHKLAKILGMEEEDVAIPNMFSLREEGKVTWDGPANSLSSDSVITLKPESSNG